MDDAYFERIIIKFENATEPVRKLTTFLGATIDDATGQPETLSIEAVASTIFESIAETANRVNDVPIIRPGSPSEDDDRYFVRLERWHAAVIEEIDHADAMSRRLLDSTDPDDLTRTVGVVRRLGDIVAEVPPIRPRPGDDE